MKALFVFGTRPEAIKLCPLIEAMRRVGGPDAARVCVTAQHRDLLDPVLSLFGVRPDYDLAIMSPGQTLAETSARILSGLPAVFSRERPDCVVVQGDTASTFCGALAAFYDRILVAHVEAGLRTGDLAHPFPEEAFRVMTTRLAKWHFAPTQAAADHLLSEGVSANRVWVTGNTGIDALLMVESRLRAGDLAASAWPWPEDDGRKLLLVTSHRRENLGAGIQGICDALAGLARRPDVRVVYPVHPNPNVRGPVERALGGIPNLHLLPPQTYLPFIDLMRRSYLILTDSGGVQEEAPSLGKPVLVLRETTERPEAVEAGVSVLVGCEASKIVGEAARLLDDQSEYRRRAAVRNPYGDGSSSERIAAVLNEA